ncbi:hypothetical protein Syun_007092 [Stephania yunnanensis]|uniref:F-box domain-containing protein n=1 Tax=Stephania yunnanensis TaxID=152371 RepID=A0AAP0Q228_9MAGN
MSSLPQEIIEGILSRLPVKSLLRFRCVSKSWHKLIADPNFIKIHLNQANLNNNIKIMLKSDFICSVDNNEVCDQIVNLHHPFEAPIRGAEILGSCNGLVCIKSDKEVIWLWNPSTREHKKLPEIPVEFSGSNFSIVYGFGYDPITDDYKVVRVYSYDDDDDVRHSEVKVYLLSLNSWKVIPDIPYESYYRAGRLLNGALHWVATRCNALDESSLIISFDIGDEVFREVPLPEFEDGKGQVNVAVLAGCLCILRHCKLHLEVWVMKRYGVGESWTRLFLIGQPTYNQFLGYIKPLCISKNGEILLDKDGEHLILYDPKDGRVRNISIHGLPYWYETEIYLGSLITLTFKENSGNGRIGEDA